MVTVHREAGFRFVVYLDDHAPAHVHAAGDGEAKIGLGAADGQIAIVYAIGVSRGDLRRIVRIVERRRATFLDDWARIHG